MKFVIVGYGRVGTRTARVLREEGHEVIVVDADGAAVDRAIEDGFEAYHGDASDEDTFEAVDFSTVDAVGGLTSDVNANFAACTIGEHHGARTVLRIDEDYREEIYEQYADDVDEILYPERLGAAGAKTALLGGDFNVLEDISENLQFGTLHVGEGSLVVGKRISEVETPEDCRIYAHGRAGEPLTIPLPGTELAAGDRIAVLGESDAMESVRQQLRGDA